MNPKRKTRNLHVAVSVFALAAALCALWMAWRAGSSVRRMEKAARAAPMERIEFLSTGEVKSFHGLRLELLLVVGEVGKDRADNQASVALTTFKDGETVYLRERQTLRFGDYEIVAEDIQRIASSQDDGGSGRGAGNSILRLRYVGKGPPPASPPIGLPRRQTVRMVRGESYTFRGFRVVMGLCFRNDPFDLTDDGVAVTLISDSVTSKHTIVESGSVTSGDFVITVRSVSPPRQPGPTPNPDSLRQGGGG